MERKPLKLNKNRWRSRWVYMPPKWNTLHRVSKAKWRYVEEYGGSYVEGTGTTVCGKSGEIRMPGILSRMGLKRCPKCCKAVGIPPGHGAPFNDKELTKRQQGK